MLFDQTIFDCCCVVWVYLCYYLRLHWSA